MNNIALPPALRNDQFVFGAHTLSSMFTINSLEELIEFMGCATKRGARLIEMPYLLCHLPWNIVGQAAHSCGITEIALCHFWPMHPNGSSPCGDPLGDKRDQARALEKLGEIVAAAQTLREHGIQVRFIDGPSMIGLGYEYHISREEQFRRMGIFLRKASDICLKANLTLALEPLRHHEDKVIADPAVTASILSSLGEESLGLGLHYDVFHAIENGIDDIPRSIRETAPWIRYFHFHGNDRRAPGSWGDRQNWPSIVAAAKLVVPMDGPIPVVCEPFGAETIRENPELGAGLPIPPPLDEYLEVATYKLCEAGLFAGSKQVA